METKNTGNENGEEERSGEEESVLNCSKRTYLILGMDRYAIINI